MNIPKCIAGRSLHVRVSSLLIALLISATWSRAQGQVGAPRGGDIVPQSGGVTAQAGGALGVPGGGRGPLPPRVQAPGANPFPGQTPVNALMVTGGCCHDYVAQSEALMDTLNAAMPINWTIVYGLAGVPGGKLALYDKPGWADGFDIVVHNECLANGDLPARVVQNITHPPVARMFFHCSLHSYRVMTNDGWRELIGMTSRRHTAEHNIQVRWLEDPITAGLPPFVTPIDELYVIEKTWPDTKVLATAVSPDAGHETYPLVWTHEYRGQRVFGTALGHDLATFNANQFRELVTRGFLWALRREPTRPRPVATGPATPVTQPRR